VARIVCIANQKGGVGKTTTAVNLAATAARAGAQTLLIDLDPQCNATSGLGLVPAIEHPLLLEESIRSSILATSHRKFQVLPGCRTLQDVDRLHASGSEGGVLRKHLDAGMAGFDLVLIDCPPSLGALTQSALASSQEVLIPIQCEYYAMEGLTQMIEVIRDVMKKRQGKLAFGGILLTMVDGGLDLTREVEAEVRDFFGEVVFETVIPRDVAVAEAPSHGKSVLEYAPRSRGTRAYMELCMEVMDRD
jgi:chromosome partitioning protein